MPFPRLNALDQALDIAGSLFQSQTMTESEEPLGFGAPIPGQTGSAATITAFNSGVSTIGGLTGMSATDTGNFLTMSGAATSGNNGTFLIILVHSATSVDVANPTGSFPDANSGSLVWTERGPYTLQDDINYIRTDRQEIKGTTNWYDPIPVYQRPTAVGTNVPANLTNIATKTTDAVAYIVNRAFFGESVAATNTLVTLTAAGQLKHSDPVDRTGIPVFDSAPFTGDWNACYVHIVDGYTGSPTAGGELFVLSGPHAGERIFGQTYNGSSTSPNSVEVHFYSAPINVNYATSATAYTWEAGQPTTINLLYGYNERLDLLDENAFRTVPALGILTDASLQLEINNILSQIGSVSGDTSLNGLLTNTGPNFIFNNLPNATPTVVDALNTLNAQVGDRTYTGPILTSGQTIAASLQALSNAISSSHVSRTIERLAAPITVGTVHTLPGGLTYTLDGTNNGQFLWVFERGVLLDPGPVSGGNDYTETSTTSITLYKMAKTGDHLNYFVKS